ncbi:MAG: DUF2971 domain-containing protein [Gemmatimonadota bacterium]
MPAILYKYRSVAPASWLYTEAALEKQELFMATRAMFNDPFECRPVFSHECTKEELRAAADRILKKTPLNGQQRRARVREIARGHKDQWPQDFARAVKQLNEAMDRQVGLFCLTAKGDDILMWSHYADAHAGICMGFSTEECDSPFRNARPVRYSRDLPVCRVFAEDRNVVEEKAMFTKADAWAYEEEWRLINFRDGACTKRFEPRFLRQVILGARIAPEVATKVIRLTEKHYPHVQILNACIRENSYGLNLTAV